ncbi:hypothetical protein [Bradyrhizobium sp. SZCCHNRI1073]|uniref:hypothetical protein n=1 Tax=unclassified Bradyrhizobium TaxID=2631580 RepID=UPI0029164D68|nr:hypothetical protein [Bradyrhizobium sp. SZCCHNRI1073]
MGSRDPVIARAAVLRTLDDRNRIALCESPPKQSRYQSPAFIGSRSAHHQDFVSIQRTRTQLHSNLISDRKSDHSPSASRRDANCHFNRITNP